jgi:hypothetical protein
LKSRSRKIDPTFNKTRRQARGLIKKIPRARRQRARQRLGAKNAVKFTLKNEGEF